MAKATLTFKANWDFAGFTDATGLTGETLRGAWLEFVHFARYNDEITEAYELWAASTHWLA